MGGGEHTGRGRPAGDPPGGRARGGGAGGLAGVVGAVDSEAAGGGAAGASGLGSDMTVAAGGRAGWPGPPGPRNQFRVMSCELLPPLTSTLSPDASGSA